MSRQIIYDFGANNGDDIPYYLLKADMVVAVEANPALCTKMANRFAAEIHDRRLVIENSVVHYGANDQVAFFIPKTGIAGLEDHHSTFVDPELLQGFFKGREKYDRIQLRARPASEIVAQYGAPHYIKIDIEHSDAEILAELFAADLRPPYISAESHSIRVLAELVAGGGYRQFKLWMDRVSQPLTINACFYVANRDSCHLLPLTTLK
jgi:FkbM family methyltransferase